MAAVFIPIFGLLGYEPEAGLGLLMSRRIPFVIAFWLAWVSLLAIWFYADLSLGPGSGIFL